jgi:hypothetical protein
MHRARIRIVCLYYNFIRGLGIINRSQEPVILGHYSLSRNASISTEQHLPSKKKHSKERQDAIYIAWVKIKVRNIKRCLYKKSRNEMRLLKERIIYT